MDSGIQAARKSDFQYVRTFTDRCQLGFKPCTNQTNKAEINLNDSLAVLAHEMYLLLRRQYSSLTSLVCKMLCFGFVIGIFFLSFLARLTLVWTSPPPWFGLQQNKQPPVTFCALLPFMATLFLMGSFFALLCESRGERH